MCLLGVRALAELELGRWDDGTETAAGVLAGPSCASIEPRFYGRVVLGLVRARRGDPDSQPLLEEALGLAVDDGQTNLRAVAAIASAEAAWLAGRAELIASITDDPYATIQRVGVCDLAGELAVWRRRAGVIEEAPAIPLLSDQHRLQLCGDGRAAAAILRERGRPYTAALALLDTGDAAALREAHEELRALGAAPAAARAARGLRELGERAIPRGPRAKTRSNVAQLTPRELDVLPLLAEGLRNAEIAERLVVSPKTVDHHVSAILRKLDVRTRGQAGAAAARFGLLDS